MAGIKKKILFGGTTIDKDRIAPFYFEDKIKNDETVPPDIEFKQLFIDIEVWTIPEDLSRSTFKLSLFEEIDLDDGYGNFDMIFLEGEQVFWEWSISTFVLGEPTITTGSSFGNSRNFIIPDFDKGISEGYEIDVTATRTNNQVINGSKSDSPS